MSIGLGIGNSISGKVSGFGGGGIDPAQAYITAAGITDPTEQAAVNQLVLDLKGQGSTTNNTDVWSDSYAIYPLSPTSLIAAEYNLKDPTQNITWFNSPTHAYTGITGNGLDAYGDTNWNPTTEGVDINNAGLTYSGEYSDSDYALGVYNLVRWFVIRNLANRKIGYIGASASAVNPIDFNRSISTAVRTSERLIKMYTDGAVSSSNSTPSGGSVVPNANFFLLGYSNSGALSAPFAGEMDFVAIHKGLTANQAKDLSDAITTYNTAVRIDPDATAYITAAGITDPTEQAAVIQLVSDLKGTGSTTNNTDLWTGLDAIYPTSPTSLAAAEYNLKDPATYQITWNNGPTHSSAGVAFNGSNQYGDTGYAAIDGLQNDHSLGTNFSAYSGGNGSLMGSRTADSPNLFNGFLEFSNRTYYAVNRALGPSRSGGVTSGHYIVNRDSSLVTLYKDSIDITRVTNTSTGQDVNNYMIGAYNFDGVPTFLASGTMNFTHIGASLTANQVTDLYDAITTYNTAVR